MPSSPSPPPAYKLPSVHLTLAERQEITTLALEITGSTGGYFSPVNRLAVDQRAAQNLLRKCKSPILRALPEKQLRSLTLEVIRQWWKEMGVWNKHWTKDGPVVGDEWDGVSFAIAEQLSRPYIEYRRQIAEAVVSSRQLSSEGEALTWQAAAMMVRNCWVSDGSWPNVWGDEVGWAREGEERFYNLDMQKFEQKMLLAAPKVSAPKRLNSVQAPSKIHNGKVIKRQGAKQNKKQSRQTTERRSKRLAQHLT